MQQDGSFSFLNNNMYTFPIPTSLEIQGNIERLNTQIARLYFTQGPINKQEIPTPPEIQVTDTTLREPAPKMPPNDNIILMWTSDYEVKYDGQLILKLNMQRQYSCRLTACTH